ILVILLLLLPPVLVYIALPSLGFIPRSVPACKSPLEVIHPSFPLLMSVTPSILSLLRRQTMQSR
ncbi:hypothetical protein EV401DRAFT_1975756, partial [Pisolithus croceorrhizus]